MKLGYSIEVKQALDLVELACRRVNSKTRNEHVAQMALELAREILSITSEKDDKYYG